MKLRYPLAPVLFISVVFSLGRAAEPAVIPLWPEGAPGSEARRHEPELARDWWVKNIHHPSLTVFLPPEGKANGCAVIVAPGGGFRELVFNAEGVQAGEFLSQLGVTVFALKYRLPGEANSPYTLATVREDARRAVRLVRSRAAEYHLDPERIGMLGFSAGGAVVMMVAFDQGKGDPQAADPIDRASARLNFQLMVYPGGEVPARIPAGAPPAFLLCANDDEYGCDEVTLDLLQKFRAAKVPVELHLTARGRHAFNMGDRSEFQAVRNWPHRMHEWLQDSGYLTPAGKK